MSICTIEMIWVVKLKNIKGSKYKGGSPFPYEEEERAILKRYTWWA